MLTSGNKTLLQDAEIVVLNLYKMKCIRQVTSCFVFFAGFSCPSVHK